MSSYDRVHQHHAAPRGRRQLRPQAAEAVLMVHLGARPRRMVRRQVAHVGRVQLEEAQRVLRPQQLPGDLGRARVAAEPAFRVEGPHQAHVIGHRRRQVAAVPESQDAVLELALLLRLGTGERVAAGAGVGIDQGVGLVLERHVAQHLGQHHVLEDVGVVARVKGVSVGEHGRIVAPGRHTGAATAPRGDLPGHGSGSVDRSGHSHRAHRAGAICLANSAQWSFGGVAGVGQVSSKPGELAPACAPAARCTVRSRHVPPARCCGTPRLASTW